jgi:hypothetical protein
MHPKTPVPVSNLEGLLAVPEGTILQWREHRRLLQQFVECNVRSQLDIFLNINYLACCIKTKSGAIPAIALLGGVSYKTETKFCCQWHPDHTFLFKIAEQG